MFVVIALAVSTAVLVVLAAGLVVGTRRVAVPNIAPLLSLPPIPTVPPVTHVDPLPSALPTGSVIPSLAWTSENDGVVSVEPSGDGVDVALLQVGQKQWVPVRVPSASSALRLDATVTATTNSNGNHVGLACKTPDNKYGATFSIDVNGSWFLSLDSPAGDTLLDNAQSSLIHEDGAANQLSIVCIEHSHSFEMMYAINGTVVADALSPGLTPQPLYPELYLCSCHGRQAMHDSGIAVSSVPFTG